LNPHDPFGSRDFKSRASAYSATRPFLNLCVFDNLAFGENRHCLITERSVAQIFRSNVAFRQPCSILVVLDCRLGRIVTVMPQVNRAALLVRNDKNRLLSSQE
jgi:hypothetical protein